MPHVAYVIIVVFGLLRVLIIFSFFLILTLQKRRDVVFYMYMYMYIPDKTNVTPKKFTVCTV